MFKKNKDQSTNDVDTIIDHQVNTEQCRSKVFFINGGAGRMLAAIPALERYFDKYPDTVIVCEGTDVFFKNNKKLFKRTFHPMQKNLFEDYIRDRDIVTPEPYRRWEYYNQQCNISQGFDLEINGTMSNDMNDYRANIFLTSIETVKGQVVINQVKEMSGKESVIVLQPFGAGIKSDSQMIFDYSGRSIEFSDTVKLIEMLSKDHAVILMSELDVTLPYGLKVGRPKANLREWAAIIKASDYFIGCDSVGQHIAFSMNIPSTIICGATYPENVSYFGMEKFKIVDLGKENREYSSIRIGFTDDADTNNADLMRMTEDVFDEILNNVNEDCIIKISDLKPQIEQSSCGGNCNCNH